MSKPLLPTFDKLEKYIRRIDDNRLYTNFSPLEAEYRARISELFDCPCITGSSATSLITAALMAFNLPKASFIAIPSWTFPATAAAVVSAGMIPYFHDVDPKTYAIERWNQGGKYDALIVVSPFGAPIKISMWEDFVRVFNIPVIIDAAAGFDAFSTICKPSNIPVIISTHATKAFGTGEGGLLFTKNTPFLERVRRITNFGLTPDRRIEYTGLNAKFSEYHAAVGLAELDGWSEKRLKLLEAVKPYGIDYAVTQVPVRREGKKRVYGCHIHDAYKDYPHTDLTVTDELIENVGVIQVGI